MGRSKKPKPPKPVSIRAYRSKQRKKQGLHLAAAILSDEHLDALCKLEWLSPDQRQSRPDIQAALANFLYAKLVEQFAYTTWAIAARQQRLDARLATAHPPRQKRPDPSCPQCKKSFTPRKLQKFCSVKCRKQAENHRAYARRTAQKPSLSQIPTQIQNAP